MGGNSPAATFFLEGIMLKKIRNKSAVVGASVLGAVGSAHAALPAEATAAFTAIQGNVTDILAAIWPIVIASVGGFVLIKLFRKGANKAT